MVSLGVADPEVGVVKLVAAGDAGDPAAPGRVLALLSTMPACERLVGTIIC